MKINMMRFLEDLCRKGPELTPTELRHARPVLPYVAQRLANGRHIVLNRDYKPLGVVGMWYAGWEGLYVVGSVKYEDFPAWHVTLDDPQDTDAQYLHPDDGSGPATSKKHQRAYFNRLRRLVECIKESSR